MKTYILYNPAAGNSDTTRMTRLQEKECAECLNIQCIDSYKTFFASLSPDDKIIILGGDGTLMRFANATYEIDYENEIYYLPYGTGNDFYRDAAELVGMPYDLGEDSMPIKVNQFLKPLPEVTIDGNTYKGFPIVPTITPSSLSANKVTPQSNSVTAVSRS